MASVNARSVRGTPLVSIVMPVYNHAGVLPFAIDSVRAQTLQDFELIIVDDASLDATAEIIAEYAARDGRIRPVRNQVNSRHAEVEWEPRNDGLRLAGGSLVAYLDADNTWHPEFLAALSCVLLARPDVMLAYCDSRNFHDPTALPTVITRDRRDATAQGRDWVVFGHGTIVPAWLGSRQYVDTNEIMHRRSIFATLGHGWRTAHPRRAWVNRQQGARCPYRRHNDLDLVERIVDQYGVEGTVYLPRVLVNFYYPSAVRSPRLAASPEPPGSASMVLT
jgi:glycosyltransferase involved in cell wall biosynthesis